MAKPSLSLSGNAAAWGDLAETTEPMLGNLFVVSIRLPTALKALYKGQGAVLSTLCSAADIPEEVLEVVEVPTKLSTYDVVVGKTRGELSLTFKEQTGAPVSTLMNAWHKSIIDARDSGIGYPADYRAEIWVGATTGDGTPYYWWGHSGAFPKSKGKPTFGNDQKNPIEIIVPFSYVKIIDSAEALTGEGANMAARLSASAAKLGV